MDSTEYFNFSQYIIEINRPRPDKLAYIDESNTISYRELSENIVKLAGVLLDLGIRREERVLLCMRDCIEWPVSFLGALYVGILPVAVNTLLSKEDYAYILTDSRAQLVICTHELYPQLVEALAWVDHEVKAILVIGQTPTPSLSHIPVYVWQDVIRNQKMDPSVAQIKNDDPGFWLYSSGSTGQPKAVVHTQQNLFWTAELYGKKVLGMKDTDVCYSMAKLFFAYGLGNALSFPLSVGATVVLYGGRPTPDAVFRILNHQSVTVFFGAPTGYVSLLAFLEQTTIWLNLKLRLCSSAGEALPKEVGMRWQQTLKCPILDGIGSTEMLHIYLSNTLEDNHYGTSGKVVNGYHIELRDEYGNLVQEGELGDLYVKGPSCAMMYWRNIAKSRSTFQGEWLKTGDKYMQNGAGYLVYSGRNDDMLKVSGQYVSPFEVESTVLKHPSVLECAVVGVPDEQGLTKTIAYIVLKEQSHLSEIEIQNFVKNDLAPFKYPRKVRFVKELPKTATGKIQRFKLRNLEKNG